MQHQEKGSEGCPSPPLLFSSLLSCTTSLSAELHDLQDLSLQWCDSLGDDELASIRRESPAVVAECGLL